MIFNGVFLWKICSYDRRLTRSVYISALHFLNVCLWGFERQLMASLKLTKVLVIKKYPPFCQMAFWELDSHSLLLVLVCISWFWFWIRSSTHAYMFWSSYVMPIAYIWQRCHQESSPLVFISWRIYWQKFIASLRILFTKALSSRNSFFSPIWLLEAGKSQLATCGILTSCSRKTRFKPPTHRFNSLNTYTFYIDFSLLDRRKHFLPNLPGSRKRMLLDFGREINTKRKVFGTFKLFYPNCS